MSDPLPLNLREAKSAIKETIAHGAAGAYRHPLGFDHIALFPSGPWKDRLHVWSPQHPRLEAIEIHDHKFSFTSVVIAGAILHQPYTVEPVALRAEATHRLLSVIQGEHTTKLTASEQLVRATPLAAETVHKGETYEFDAGRFHFSSNLADGRSITFVRAQKSLHSPSSVLSKDLYSKIVRWRRTPLEADDVTALLEQALIEIEALEVAESGATK